MKYLITLMLLCVTLPATEVPLTPQNTEVTFKVRHLFISTVKGRFTRLHGRCDIEKERLKMLFGSVEVASITTGSEKRDTHLVSEAFFDAARYPRMSLQLKSVDGDRAVAALTIRQTTHDLPLKIDKQAGTILLTGKISRKAYGLVWGKAVEATGAVVGDTVRIAISITPGVGGD